MNNPIPPPLGTRLASVATALGWRVKFHGVTSDSWPIAALYDSGGEYVGLVHVMHNALVTRGAWDLSATRNLSLLRRAYSPGVSCVT